MADTLRDALEKIITSDVNLPKDDGWFHARLFGYSFGECSTAELAANFAEGMRAKLRAALSAPQRQEPQGQIKRGTAIQEGPCEMCHESMEPEIADLRRQLQESQDKRIALEVAIRNLSESRDNKIAQLGEAQQARERAAAILAAKENILTKAGECLAGLGYAGDLSNEAAQSWRKSQLAGRDAANDLLRRAQESLKPFANPLLDRCGASTSYPDDCCINTLPDGSPCLAKDYRNANALHAAITAHLKSVKGTNAPQAAE